MSRTPVLCVLLIRLRLNNRVHPTILPHWPLPFSLHRLTFFIRSFCSLCFWSVSRSCYELVFLGLEIYVIRSVYTSQTLLKLADVMVDELHQSHRFCLSNGQVCLGTARVCMLLRYVHNLPRVGTVRLSHQRQHISSPLILELRWLDHQWFLGQGPCLFQWICKPWFGLH